MVVADAGRGDWILCQITSRSYADPRAVQLTDPDFGSGSLRVVSYARPAKLFTADQGLFVAEAGRLKPTALQSIINEIISLLQKSS